MANPLGITEVVLRDAHQSLIATRLRLEDMLPICPQLDRIGYWSMESWGGATYDACIRYLGEDPWERLRELKKALPNTRQQMLLRGQNLLGYRHYADDVVVKFIERAAENGVDVFRIFDAMNDLRNMHTAVRATIDCGKHAQGTISYTVSPVHTIEMWIDMAKQIEDLGCHSVAIKDMAGLLSPYVAEELVQRLKASLAIPVHMQCHATTGLSTATILKAVEAGIDNVDTAISSMSLTYGHSPTEAVVAMLQGTDRDTRLDLNLLEEVALYFREVRKKYAKFEGSLRGADSRILVAQVPGGMLTNMENQLREQCALERFDEVLQEIPRVREDLGYIPLVTPTSQIVGTQAVINVLAGERYKTITRETAGVLRGEYGATPAPVNTTLQQRALAGDVPITCRPADLLKPEYENQKTQLEKIAADRHLRLASQVDEDVLTYAMFGQVALKYLQNRDNPAAFEPVPGTEPVAPVAPVAAAAPPTTATAVAAAYDITVNGNLYRVLVAPSGAVAAVQPAAIPVATADPPAAPANSGGQPVQAPMAGTVLQVRVAAGQRIADGDVVVIMETMKMETEVRSRCGGVVATVHVRDHQTVAAGELLISLVA